jgi:hypothetical protein
VADLRPGSELLEHESLQVRDGATRPVDDEVLLSRSRGRSPASRAAPAPPRRTGR